MAQVAIPDAATGTGGNWTDTNTMGALYAAIDDGPSTGVHDPYTWVEVEDMGGDDTFIVSLSDLSKPGAGNVTFTIAASTDDNMGAGQGPRLRLDLCETTSFTVRATHIFTGIALNGSDSFTHYDSDALDVSSVSDDKWDELFVKITMLTNGGASDYMYLSQVFLTTPDAGAAAAVAADPDLPGAAFLMFID